MDVTAASTQEVVSRSDAEGIACLTLDNPPVNALGAAMRSSIARHLDDVERDASIVGVVLHAAGRMFSGGGDVRELGRPPAPDAPTMTELTARIEKFAKPVVVALHGKVIGGGALLSMACHARVGRADTQIALPEVRLGFVPGAGGTQRLPRLVGLRTALEIVALADTLSADAAQRAGWLDSVVDADPCETTTRIALDIASGRRPWRRTATLSVAQTGETTTQLREALRDRAAQRFPARTAPLVAIDLILGAAQWPFDDGMRREREAFEQLSHSDETKELLRQFFSQRALGVAAAPAATTDGSTHDPASSR